MIFVSHSTTDDPFVDKLAQELAIYGIRTWIDHRDMPPGEKWVKHLERALRNSDVMLLILSEESLASDYVEAEWHTFFELKRPIIPLRVDNCDVPLFLRTFHHIDFRDAQCFDSNIKALFEVLPDISGITIESTPHAQKAMTGYLKAPDSVDDLEYVISLANQILEERGATLRADSMQIILPTEGDLVQYPLDMPLMIGRNHKSLAEKPPIDLSTCQEARMVSRQHARLFYEDDTLFVEDLDSTNGTYVNGERIPSYNPVAIDNYTVVSISRKLPLVIRYN